ncbi:MAG: T9SS type A sorting domain-containing protein [Gemmatimonadetes bacterium]|nr:T9SS type A sorting domain-containing protein [Gemmatimonadota bacterium]
MRRFIRNTIMTSILMAASAGTSDAVIVSGQVTNESAVGIPNVDLDFFDRNLGEFIVTSGDDTDFQGNYSVDVPISEYDIFFNAPVGSPYLDAEVRMDITGATTIDMTLLFAYAANGLVTDTMGTGLFNVDLDFYNKGQADVIETNDDNTDVLGQFNVLVPAATYDVRFTPPAGDPYAGYVVPDVVIGANLDLGTIVLEPGLFVSGQVVDQGLSPIENLDFDYEDDLTGDVIFTPRDNTDGSGDFNTAVPAGSYRVVLNPPTGSGLAYKAISITVGADTTLGQITMEPGFTLSGIVQEAGAVPVVNADLDILESSTGDEIPTDNDNTNASGNFAMTTPAATVDLVVKPPAGAPLAVHITRNLAVPGNLNVGTIVLSPGFVISGQVTDANANPLPGADIDLVEIGTGLPYPTLNDDTDLSGNYSIRAEGNGYYVIANPPTGVPLAPDTVVVNPLSSNTVVNFSFGAVVVGVGDGVPARAGAFYAHPNPFNPTTTIRFDIAQPGRAVVSVYNVNGRRVQTLLDRVLSEGTASTTWNGLDDAGNSVASGRYIAVLRANGETVTTPLVLLR